MNDLALPNITPQRTENLEPLLAEAVFAICPCWPERVASKDINLWLPENQGYWWVTDLLAGKAVRL